jgi:hypothetical protein
LRVTTLLAAPFPSCVRNMAICAAKRAAGGGTTLVCWLPTTPDQVSVGP